MSCKFALSLPNFGHCASWNVLQRTQRCQLAAPFYKAHTPCTTHTHTNTWNYFIQWSKCCGRCHESETCLGAAMGRCHDSRISFNIFLAIYFVFLFRFCSLFPQHAAVAATAACFGCRLQWHLKHKVQGKQAWEGPLQHCNQQCHSSSSSTSSCRKGISF